MPTMTQQIFLASRTEEENHILRRKLEVLTQEFSPIQFVSTHPQGLVASVDRYTAIVVLNFNEWSGKEAQTIDELRAAGFRGAIVLMAKVSLPEAVRELRSLEGVVFVEKPFEPRDLIGIVRKFLEARMVAQRIHRRYNTSQDAEVEFAGRDDGDKMISRLFNLSKGGAYMEFMTATPVKVGELLRIKLELKEVNRTYTMPAKVVWAKKSTPSGGTGIGIEFLGPGDVQKVILGSY